MTNRHCRADADLKQIWQLLLPDTPFPACGAEDAGAAKSESARPANQLRGEAQAQHDRFRPHRAP